MILTEEEYQNKVVKSAMSEILRQVPLQYEHFCTIEKYLNYVYELGYFRRSTRGNVKKNVAIEQIKKGKIINEYKSISDAARDNEISIEAIRKVVRGINNTAKGFYWRVKTT
ncbi:MAG TPA: hypothetical protein PLQ69_07745 [Paludibacter sp.]|nr:hypothetical protein [Paludibacter sp.]